MERISEIKFEITSDDLIEYQKITARENKISLTGGFILGIVAIFLIFADFIYSIVIGAIEFNPAVIFLNLFGRLILFTALAFISAGVLNLIHKKAVKNLNISDKNGVFCEHRIILTEAEFIELTDVNIARYSWATIGEITENEKFVVIPVNLSFSHIIPKRAFEDEIHIKNFIDTAVEYKEKSQHRFNPSYIANYELNS
jgi:hypothetical protein